MELKEITHLITNGAESLNINKWDFGASFSNDFSVQVDKGIAKQLKASQKQVLTLRVWNNKNLVGITTTSDLRPHPSTTHWDSRQPLPVLCLVA